MASFWTVSFYGLAFFVWDFASLGILGGGDIRKFLGLLAGAVAVPLYGLFLLASVVLHIRALVRCQYDRIPPLFLVNVVGIVAYVIIVLVVLTFAMHR